MESSERRQPSPVQTRGRAHLLWDVLFTGMRFIARHAQNAYAAFGLVIVGGIIVAVGLTYGFAKFAERVMSGGTMRFDDAAMQFMGAHQVPWISSAMVEITSLG